MRAFSRYRKQFCYTSEISSLAPLTSATLRTAISADGFFDLAGISIASIDAAFTGIADRVLVRAFDESSGRELYSGPLPLSSFGRLDDTATRYDFTAAPYFPCTRHRFRPASIVRLELSNTDAGISLGATQIVFHGEKITDLNPREESAGTVFEPFRYVADFGTVNAGTQRTVAVQVQSDAMFDIVAVQTPRDFLNQVAAVRNKLFVEFQDLASQTLLQDRAIRLPLVSGSPHYPYRLIRPYRVDRSTGFSITLRNDHNAAFDAMKIVLDGYKVY